MKRTQQLRRKSALRSRPRLPHRTETGREAWKSCERCGVQYEPWRESQRFCSKSCAASGPRPGRRVDRNAPNRDRYGRLGVAIRCEICGSEFIVPPSTTGKRKTCSPACAASLKRARGGANRTGKANPNYKSGKRVGVRDRAGEERWYAGAVDRCQAPNCPGPKGALALHHICYRQHVRRAGGDIWDPRNALTLCASCHSRQHRRSRVLPVSCLPDAALAFAVDLLGAYAADHLRRYYFDDGDPRLAAIDSQEMAA